MKAHVDTTDIDTRVTLSSVVCRGVIESAFVYLPMRYHFRASRQIPLILEILYFQGFGRKPPIDEKKFQNIMKIYCTGVQKADFEDSFL